MKLQKDILTFHKPIYVICQNCKEKIIIKSNNDRYTECPKCKKQMKGKEKIS